MELRLFYFDGDLSGKCSFLDEKLLPNLYPENLSSLFRKIEILVQLFGHLSQKVGNKIRFSTLSLHRF